MQRQRGVLTGIAWRRVALLAAVAGLAGGLGAQLAGAGGPGRLLLTLTVVAALGPLAVAVARGLVRREPGVDVIALLAMVGALALGEVLAGAVIAVMLASGRLLEGYAGERARRELSALLRRAPQVAHRYEQGGLVTCPLELVRRGDRLLVESGEVVPVDGTVLGHGAVAVLDESALTGEAVPVERHEGEPVQSGVANVGAPFELRATTTAAESTYAGIVRLVEQAQASKAPFVRLADRYALGFVPLTLATAGAAWALSGSPVRALAVLVVATPCPLILAAPVAIVAGVSRAARRGVIIKSGAALERLAQTRVLLVDKTGTLTSGQPVVAEVATPGGDADELLRLAASLDQLSPHVLAAAIVRAATERGLALELPSGVAEEPGRGIRGMVGGHSVAIGKAAWVAPGQPLPGWARRVRRRAAFEGAAAVFVAVDGVLAGVLGLRDQVRPDTPRTLRELRHAGVRRIVLVSGDHTDAAETVGAALGVDQVLAERSPADKVEAVRAERAAAAANASGRGLGRGWPWRGAAQRGAVVMVGDGVNDAPALAASDVGVAMGARGATASSQAGDVVVTVDRLDRLAEAIRIAARARRIALQSVLAGMGLSALAMAAAAAGLLVPVAGAVVQEVIDVAAIGNALRALRTGAARTTTRPPSPAEAALGQRFRGEHRELLGTVERLRSAADRLDAVPPPMAASELAGLRRLLSERLLPHEQAEDTLLYPVVERLVGGDDPTVTMSREHREIAHLVRLLARLLDDLGPGGPEPDDLPELRRVLYALHAILRLHFAQEEEAYLSLLGDGSSAATAATGVTAPAGPGPPRGSGARP
jgi:heavy metal translocating P-type ATPase